MDQLHALLVLAGHFLVLSLFAVGGGPSLIVPLIGFRAASWPGAVVSIVAFLVLPMTLTFFVGRLLHQHDNEWLARIRRGFRPATGGLWIVSGIVIATATDHGVAAVGITLGVAILALIVDISPMWWCLIAGAAGALLV